MMLLPLIIVGVAIYYFTENKKGYGMNTENPLDKLQERYINGEIDEETYIKMKKVIQK